MSDNEIGIAISIFALFASIGSAIFSFLQARWLNKQIRTETYSKTLDINRELIRMAIDDSELSKVLDGEEIEDKSKQNRYLQLWINHTDMIFLSNKNGLIPSYMWESLCNDIKDLFQLAPMALHWMSVKKYYDQDFIEFIDSITSCRSSHYQDDHNQIINLMPPWRLK